MYLKSLEMCGFKSFADRTKLIFEPGLIAIVGPNGCGKSNVSDAIRWVLGEQRPSALRGAKMLDVVFNGTDSRKQMAMAEVSITFAECDKTLDTEFDEVTVTRRVFRTGDSGYYINKSPCRLKDIQRLFMGTGIGTTSYSVMAQGQIDAILSSRPEDRRTIFEEAAGVTKYKADRKEALRKLEQTEANLVRLADVIREVKRQIGNLQRQVGKAQRYKELKAELRGIDIFAAKHHLSALNLRIEAIDTELAELASREEKGLAAVADAENRTAALRLEISEDEEKINAATESAAQDEGSLQHAKDIIRIGEQRIEEYRSWAERDTLEASQIKIQLVQLENRITELENERDALAEKVKSAAAEREESQRRVAEEKAALDQMRRDLAGKRDESMERERRTAYLQNQLGEMEASLRSASVQRERLTGEHDKLQADLAQLKETCDVAADEHEALLSRAEDAHDRCEETEADLADLRERMQAKRDELNAVLTDIASQRAKIDLLREQEESAESMPGGSKMLLDAANPLSLADGVVLGPLADKFRAPPKYRAALEAVLRAWIDAVVLRDAADAADVVRRLLATGKPASSRLVAAGGVRVAAPAALAGLEPLLAQVQVSPDFREGARSLLSGVFLADSVDAVPLPVPAGCTIVTLDGAVFRADGRFELWMPEGQAASPLARRLAISDGEELISAGEDRASSLKADLEEASARESAYLTSLSESRREYDNFQRFAAQKEGELNSARRDCARCEERLAVVAEEIRQAREQTREADEEKAALADELRDLLAERGGFLDKLSEMQRDLQEREADYNDHNQELTEIRLREANRSQELTQVKGQIEIYENRKTELGQSLEGRSKGVKSYDESITKLTEDIERTRAGLEPMRQRAERSRAELEALKAARAEKNHELERSETGLAAARQGIDAIRGRRGRIDVEKAELTVRRQNRLDLIQNEYGLSYEQLLAEPAPEWGEKGEPTLEEAEKHIAELSAAIQALGPVNLVAIEECQELEARYEREKAQEDDLLKSKDQLLELVKMINQKSSEMFKETFEQANANFETMFAKLFSGGTAKLVMVENPEDPLECGVEIIARPPGKRLQSISLLSGGERTMTAVSLLFAIYMIKPSPFCLLDELDAALDDSNIGRFVQALKDFLSQSQFLIITHNQHSIANSSIVYGVTMPEKGVSKIVSMRLPDIGVKDLEVGREEKLEDIAIPIKKKRRSRKADA